MHSDRAWIDLIDPQSRLGAAIVLGCALLLGALCAWLAGAILDAAGQRLSLTRRNIAPALGRLRAPLLLSIPPLLALAATAALEVTPADLEVVRHLLRLWLIAGVTWVLVRAAAIAANVMISFQQLTATDNLHARRVYTQIRFVQRALTVLLVLLGLGAMLVTFSSVRQIGVSVLASAGIAGIIIGLAAQQTLGTLFAGLQIAIAQPIRIDDVLVIDGEWGNVEEITLTYVVLRTWDLRRLIVPITRLLDQPFQNWTRTSANLLGTAYLYLDYTAPVTVIRARLKEVLDEAPQWDGKVWNLQVTNLTDHGVELRALMSAADSGSTWDLRCHVRERLLEYLQEQHPQSLPRVRLERLNADAASAGQGGDQ